MEYSEKGKWVTAYRCLFEVCEDIPTGVRDIYENLPDTLIVKRGKYKVFDETYSLEEEGLYRFIQRDGRTRQVIVFEGENIDHLMSALSWSTVHGVEDGGLSQEEMYRKSFYQKLVLTCGDVSLWASAILTEQGIKNRIVHTLTLDEWNWYDNGHTMLEIYKESIGQWAVYDIDNGITFSCDSKQVNILQLCDVVGAGQPYQIHYLSKGASYAGAPANVILFEKFLSGELNLRKWLKRVLQVPMIRNKDGNYDFFDKGNRGRIEGYSKAYSYVEKERFMELYYPA